MHHPSGAELLSNFHCEPSSVNFPDAELFRLQLPSYSAVPRVYDSFRCRVGIMITDMITGAEFFRYAEFFRLQVPSSSIVPSVQDPFRCQVGIKVISAELLSAKKLSLYSDAEFSSFSDAELCLSDAELPCF